MKTRERLKFEDLLTFNPVRLRNGVIITVASLGILIAITAIADGGVAGVQKFIQFVINGIGLGVIYALVALGFVVVYKSTRMFNFAQGGLVTLGAYMSYQFIEGWSVPFFLGVLCSAIVMAIISVGIERVVIRPMIGKPIYAAVLVTLGVLLAINQVIPSIWRATAYTLVPPWLDAQKGVSKSSEIFGITIQHGDLWNALVVLIFLIGFWLLFQFTNLGLGMRATAISQEVAASQGVNVGLSFSASWAIAGAIGAISGTLLIFERSGSVETSIAFFTFKAFPAMILGGLDSIIGAVVAGIILGVVEVLANSYLNDVLNFLEWLLEWLLEVITLRRFDIEISLGDNFSDIILYLMMVVILLVRPSGLFGTKEVKRL